MRRGEETIVCKPWLPFGWGIRRSSDGLWQEDGKILPWFWFKVRPNTASIPGFCVKFGEYMISVGWVGW
jgi:hypothetical protein